MSQLPPDPFRCGCCAALNIKLLHDRLHMPPGCRASDMQPLADLLIGETIAEQLQHFALAPRELQRVWVAFAGDRHGCSAGVKSWAGVCGTIQPSQLPCIPPLQELAKPLNGFCVTTSQLNS